MSRDLRAVLQMAWSMLDGRDRAAVVLFAIVGLAKWGLIAFLLVS